MQQHRTVLPTLPGPRALHGLVLLHLLLSIKLVSWSSLSCPKQKAGLEEAHKAPSLFPSIIVSLWISGADSCSRFKAIKARLTCVNT